MAVQNDKAVVAQQVGQALGDIDDMRAAVQAVAQALEGTAWSGDAHKAMTNVHEDWNSVALKLNGDLSDLQNKINQASSKFDQAEQDQVSQIRQQTVQHNAAPMTNLGL